MTITPDDAMASAQQVLREKGETPAGFAAVGEVLKQLALEPGLLSDVNLAQLHQSDAGFTIIARGAAGEALMLSRFPPESPTPIHNHNSFGVICVVRGRDRHVTWTPSEAGLIRGEEVELGEGDVLTFGPPPDDIHSQQGIDGDAWELVFFGKDPTIQARTYYDPETGAMEVRNPAG